MKSYFLIVATLILLFSCSAPEENTIPEALEAKRTLLQEKKKDLQAMKKEIENLEALIQEQSGVTPEENFPLVELDTLQKGTFSKYVELPASVGTDDLVNISSEFGGRIIQLNLEEGRYIKKGALVASLDNESIRYQRAEIETRLQLAQTIFDKQKRLWDQNIGSEIQYLEAKNNKEALEKSLQTLDNQMSKFKIYAPISGTVDSKLAKQGEVLAPGQPLAMMINMNSVKVEVDVPENYLQSVKKGDWVEVSFPALNETRKARIDLIGARINPGNRSFKVEMTLPNKGRVLKPNLLAEVKILEQEEKDVIILPVNMVQEEVGGKKFVYVAEKGQENWTAKKRYLSTGLSYDGAVIITDGLKAEEYIISNGIQGLQDNQGIRIQSK